MMFYLKRLIIRSKVEESSTIDFTPGLNIIYGPSKLGKSLVVDFIDFMFGGENEKIIENPIGFVSVTLLVDVDGQSISMRREVGSKDIEVSGMVDWIDNGIYKATNAKKNSIYQFWLKLMGISDDVQIAAKIDRSPQRLGVRTFMHFFLIREGRISDEESILKNPEMFKSNIPVPTLMSLIYLATGETYTDGKKVLSSKEKKAADDAVSILVDKSLENLKRQKFDVALSDNEIDPDILDAKVEDIKNEMAEAEGKIENLTAESRNLSKDILKLDSHIHESKVLRGRYDDLMSQYESDIRRLTFIAEGELHTDELLEMKRCPFCNGELSKEKEESCVDAAIAEVEKIRLQIQDLTAAEGELDDEIVQLFNERDLMDKRRRKIRESINDELNPRLSELTKLLSDYHIAAGKKKVAELIEEFSQTLITESGKVMKDNTPPEKIDLNNVVDEVITEPLTEWIDTILKETNYDEFKKVEFDYKSCDIKIDSISKKVQGQGYCAFLNSVMAIALQKMLVDYNHYFPGLLVLDSPILSLAEKVKDGEKEATVGMKAGLFRYLDTQCHEFQTIIVENNIPNIEYRNANLIEFTKDDDSGRYGLVKSYRMNG